MTTNQTNVVGYAVYFEVRRMTSTWQVIITPEAEAPGARAVPASMFRRRLSAAQPRKMWKQIASGSPAFSTTATSSQRMNFLTPFFDSLVGNSWKVTPGTKPIMVEVTSADMTDIAMGKAPYKIIGRVLKSRKALGSCYPAKLI